MGTPLPLLQWSLLTELPHNLTYGRGIIMTEVMKLCNGTPLQYSCLENPMDGGAWKAEVHGVAEGRTWLSDFTFTFHFHALEKKMATHSSVLAWRIPGMGEPGELPSIGSHRVGHNWSDLAAAAAAAMKLWPKCSCNFLGSSVCARRLFWQYYFYHTMDYGCSFPKWWLGEFAKCQRNGSPLQYSCLENPMDREAW